MNISNKDEKIKFSYRCYIMILPRFLFLNSSSYFTHKAFETSKTKNVMKVSLPWMMSKSHNLVFEA